MRFGLIFLCSVRYGANFILLMWISSFSNTFVGKTVLFPLNCLGTLVENHLTICMSTYTDFIDEVIDTEV